VKETGIYGSHEPVVDVQFLSMLVEIDEGIAAQVRQAGCSRCGGRLDRADYARKPRGGVIAIGAEGWAKRLSLCCSREGCRRRSTPPSVRFLGRRVYAEVVVVLACLQAASRERKQAPARGAPVRTVRRWQTWWRTVFTASSFWSVARARLLPPVDGWLLPGSLLERFSSSRALVDMARFIAPITTGSVADGSRYLRLAM
jgi:hypothetical protein